MKIPSDHMRTLKRRVDFLKSRDHKNSFDLAELGALEWAIVNLQPAPVQEPVAWGVFEGGNLHDMFFTKEEADNMAHLKGLHAEVKPLTTPPAAQRQWVGLTVDELITLEQKHMRHEDLSQAIEAKLKEKNYG